MVSRVQVGGHRTPDSPGSAPRSGKQKPETLKEKLHEEILKDRGKSKGAVEVPGFWPSGQSRAYYTTIDVYWERKLTEKWPPISSLPEATGASSRESRKERATKLALRRLRCRGQSQYVLSCRTVHQGGPASGNKHRQGSSLHSPKSAGREGRTGGGLRRAGRGETRQMGRTCIWLLEKGP